MAHEPFHVSLFCAHVYKQNVTYAYAYIYDIYSIYGCICPWIKWKKKRENISVYVGNLYMPSLNNFYIYFYQTIYCSLDVLFSCVAHFIFLYSEYTNCAGYRKAKNLKNAQPKKQSRAKKLSGKQRIFKISSLCCANSDIAFPCSRIFLPVSFAQRPPTYVMLNSWPPSDQLTRAYGAISRAHKHH